MKSHSMSMINALINDFPSDWTSNWKEMTVFRTYIVRVKIRITLLYVQREYIVNDATCEMHWNLKEGDCQWSWITAGIMDTIELLCLE